MSANNLPENPTENQKPEEKSTTGSTSHPQRIAALYVGDLHPDVTESDLLEFFKGIGAIQSIKVCRDNVTRRSLGYAYVNFTRVADADRSISLLNYSPLKGRPIRISWSQRDPSLRRSNVGNLFIKNFPKDLDSMALEEVFEAFGPIISCKVQSDDNGNSLGYGFVHFEKEVHAKAAIEKMHGSNMNGKTLYVQAFVPKKLRDGGNRAAVFTNIFAKELPGDITEKEFVALFEEFGTITSPCLKTPPSALPTTFGFINFESHEMAVKAVESMNGKEYKDRKLYVARAQSKTERMAELKKHRENLYAQTKNCNLHVCPLPTNWSEKELIEEFSKFGNIGSAKIMRQADGTSKGFGFVCFSTPEEAAKARESTLKIDGKLISVNIAQRKEDRKRFLEEQHARTMRPQLPMYRGFAPAPTPGWTANANQFAPVPPHPSFVGGIGPKMRYQDNYPQFVMRVVDQLKVAIGATHPEHSSNLAKLIFDAEKDPKKTILLLQDPQLLKQRITETLPLLQRTEN